MRKNNGNKFSQKKLIHNTDWDILILLDACRYDMFKQVYKKVFGKNSGTLKKVVSPATWTMEWLNENFPSFYDDIIYISANPFVNSETKVCHREHKQKIWYYLFKSKRGMLCYDGKKHFKEVVDVWDWGWDDKIGTVHPKMVNKGFHRSYLRNPKKRFILHYMQPHAPYISLGGKKKPSHREKVDSGGDLWTFDFRERVRRAMGIVIPTEINWEIKKKLGLGVGEKIEKIYRDHGWDGVKSVYKNEILLDLEYVKMLTESISARWVITADHGERLGEKGWYSHGGKRDREMIEVPWFEIK